MANPFVHVELNTTDPAKAKTFYGQLFDWKMEDMYAPASPVGLRLLPNTTGTAVIEVPSRSYTL